MKAAFFPSYLRAAAEVVNPNEEIRTYKLNTITYGLAPNSFLATRCIKQIALDYSQNIVVSHILLHDVYMDDLLLGLSTNSDAISLCKKIMSIKQKHGFHLQLQFLESFKNIVEQTLI